MKLCVQDRSLFPKCPFREEASHRNVRVFEKLGKLGGGEGANHEFPAWDALGMGSQFERNSRPNIGSPSLNGRRIKKMHDVRVLLIDGECPRPFAEHFGGAGTQTFKKLTCYVALACANHVGEKGDLLCSRQARCKGVTGAGET